MVEREAEPRPWLRQPWRFWLQDERGQTAFEFLIVLPFLFVFFFMAFEGTVVLKTWTVLEQASREGARCGAVNLGTSGQPDAQGCAINASCQNPSATQGDAGTNCLLGTSNVTVTGAADEMCGDSLCTAGSPVTVSVSYHYVYKTPLTGFITFMFKGPANLPSITLTAATTMRLEAQTQ
jgi:Flp pilus assembly protein TadG